jgi:hypothetical protein
MSAVPGVSNAGITVKMPFVLDVSGLTAELFGEQYDLSGTLITVGNTLSTENFYNATTGAAWLHYLQALNEDAFDVYVNRDKSAACEGDISGALKIQEGLTYDVNAARDNMDCSGVFAGQTGWTDYHSLEDFVVSWFANKILGHPGALAAISNDSYLRAQAELAFAAGILAMEGADGAALSVDGLTSLGSDDVTAGVISSGSPANGMSAADLNLIVQQIMNLAPGRFQSGDRGFLLPVQWYAGDKIQIQLNMVNNTYKIAQYNNVTVTSPDPRAVGGDFVGTAGSGSLTDDQYVLEFTMA